MTSSEWKRFRTILLMIAIATAVISVIILFFFKTKVFVGAAVRLINILQPFIFGAAIAYILRPVCAGLELGLIFLVNKCRPSSRKKEDFKGNGATRLIAILLSLAIMIAVIAMLLVAVLPELLNSISRIARQMPGHLARFRNWLNSLDQGDTSHEVVVYIQQVVDTISSKLQNFLQTEVIPNLQTLITNVTSSFMNIFDVVKNFGIGCIIASYLLGSREKLVSQAAMVVYALFPKNVADWIRREVKITDNMLSGFINGKLLDSLIIGILCFIFMSVTRMPYTMLVSVIIGVTNIIPFFGPYLGAVPALLLILTISPWKALVFLVFIILLQQFDGNFLGPLILGDKLGLSGFWILFSILVFGSMWGVVGMIIGAPLFAVAYGIFRSLILHLLRLRHQEERIQAYNERFAEKEKPPKKRKSLPDIQRRAGKKIKKP